MSLKVSQEKLKFPLTFTLKIIMDNKLELEDLQASIIEKLENADVPHRDWKHKFSKNNSYVSFSVKITLPNQTTMNALYDSFKGLEGLRMVI